MSSKSTTTASRPRLARIQTAPVVTESASRTGKHKFGIVTPPHSPVRSSEAFSTGRRRSSSSLNSCVTLTDRSERGLGFPVALIEFDQACGRLEVDKTALLGSGRFSNVYAAHQQSSTWRSANPSITPPSSPVKATESRTNSHMSKSFAVKIPVDRTSVAVLRREARILSYLAGIAGTTAYTVPFFGIDIETNGIVLGRSPCNLERLEVDVLSRLSESDRTVQLAAVFPNIARQTISALDWLRQTGVVHADIKPANILLFPTETLKHSLRPASMLKRRCKAVLADFSSSFHISEDSSPPSSPTEALGGGSYDFLAPELLRRPFPPPTFSSDVFALALSLLIFICGKSPYDGAANRYARMEMAKQGRPLDFLQGDPLAARRLRDVSAAVDELNVMAVLGRGLSKSAEHRRPDFGI